MTVLTSFILLIMFISMMIPQLNKTQIKKEQKQISTFININVKKS